MTNTERNTNGIKIIRLEQIKQLIKKHPSDYKLGAGVRKLLTL